MFVTGRITSTGSNELYHTFQTGNRRLITRHVNKAHSKREYYREPADRNPPIYQNISIMMPSNSQRWVFLRSQAAKPLKNFPMFYEPPEGTLSRLLVPFMKEINPVHTTRSHLSKIRFNIILPSIPSSC
jgi:hypothetical protein